MSTKLMELVLDEDKRLEKDGTNITPRSESSKKRFPHYCPICTFYFKRIKKLKCCENSICECCVKDIILKNETDEETEGEVDSESSSCCPFCSSSPLDVEDLTNESSNVRKYFNAFNIETPGCQSDVEKERLSPIRPGDSYDDLKRKMVFREKDGYFIRAENPPPMPSPRRDANNQRKEEVSRFKKFRRGLKSLFSLPSCSCCSVDTSMVIDTTDTVDS